MKGVTNQMALRVCVIGLILSLVSGCAAGHILQILPRGSYFQGRNFESEELELQISTPSDDWCQVLLMSSQAPTGKRSTQTFSCSSTPDSNALRYHATFNNSGSILVVETKSISLCKAILEGNWKEPAPSAPEPAGKGKGHTQAPPAVKVSHPEVVDECKEKVETAVLQ
jgi:hypothetical protein